MFERRPIGGFVVKLFQIVVTLEIANALLELGVLEIRLHERHLDVVFVLGVEFEFAWLLIYIKNNTLYLTSYDDE